MCSSDVKTFLRALPDMDKRLSNVESRQSWLMGVGAVFAGLAAKAKIQTWSVCSQANWINNRGVLSRNLNCN